MGGGVYGSVQINARKVYVPTLLALRWVANFQKKLYVYHGPLGPRL